MNEATAMSDASIESRVESSLFGEAEHEKKLPAATEAEQNNVVEEAQIDDVEKAAGESTGTLAEYLGVPESHIIETDDGKVLVSVKVNGEISHVPMMDVIASYQLQKHVNGKSMQLSEQMKTLAADKAALYSESQNRLAVMEKMTEALEAQFAQQYQQVDWQRLRHENPAEFVALQKDYENLVAGLNNAKQVTIQQRQQIEMMQEQRNAIAMDQYIGEQAVLVLQNIPEWVDPAVRQAETSSMRTFLASQYGFSDEELDSVVDARHVSIIRDAMAYRNGMKVADQKTQKPVPKFQKAGRPAAAMAQMRDVKSRRSSLKATGSIDDAASLIESRM